MALSGLSLILVLLWSQSASDSQEFERRNVTSDSPDHGSSIIDEV